MKYVGILFAVCVTGLPMAAKAEGGKMDCSVLSGTPYICVNNASAKTVTGISCTGFWGTTNMSVPGGVIRPNEGAIVKFSGKCEKTITINERGGEVYTIQGFDVNINTVLNIYDR